MHRYQELKVWHKAINLAVEVYSLTENLPKREQYGLISQINRAAISIPSNIAEGAGRNSNKDFNHFLGIALGSAFELNTQLLISNKLNYLTIDKFEDLSVKLVEIQNMLVKLKQSLK
ncbi:four helix bundle protein [Litoribacter populi]|uniref:four helix bundle protein n=1 Tax=Litoribacter populi TaxID=2598460 RepID=UPI00117F88D3|nr:four helix bundle protein [Litoribacter populi]